MHSLAQTMFRTDADEVQDRINRSMNRMHVPTTIGRGKLSSDCRWISCEGQTVAHLDDCVQVHHLGQVRVDHLPGPGPLWRDGELQCVQLSQNLGLHLRVLRDQIPAQNSQNSQLQNTCDA